jgi:hypothetical protein
MEFPCRWKSAIIAVLPVKQVFSLIEVIFSFSGEGVKLGKCLFFMFRVKVRFLGGIRGQMPDRIKRGTFAALRLG